MPLDVLVLGTLIAATRRFLGGTEPLVRLDLLGLLDVLFALFLHGFPPLWKLDRCPQDGESRKIFPLMTEPLNPSLVEGTEALARRLVEGDVEPSGGAIAALVAAWAAALAAAAADRSRKGWDGAAGARAQAQSLRTRALRLVDRGTRAHAEAMETLAERGPRARVGAERSETRDWRLGQAVRQAAQPPLELSACALSVAQLAELISSHAAGEVRADAVVAAQLAAAAARAGAHLVEINLVVGGDRQPAVQARELAEAAATAAAHASALD